MSHPDDEILVDVAINGSDAADTPSSVHDHVVSCAVCSGTVADLRRTLSFASTSSTDAAWVAPPASVWERITAQIDAPNAEASFGDVGPVAADLPRSDPTASDPPAVTQPFPLERRRDRRQRQAERRIHATGE